MAAQVRTSPSPVSSVLSLLRIAAGLLFICHGAQKIFGAFGGMMGHTVPRFSIFWYAGMIELIFGALFVLGLFTRVAAFVLCGEMAFAYFHMHAPHGGAPLQNGGELAVLYCFVFLYFIFAGGGLVSVDRIMGKRM